MPVETPSISVNPYQSNVPTVQVPQMQIGGQSPAQPLQGQFKGKGTGIMALGDSILKGFIQGHEYKAQKKAAQATATISAANASTDAAFAKYQESLTAANGNVNDPAAKAAYGAYQDVFNKGKQAMAQFAIPDETTKKPAKGAKDKMKAGFSNIKEFMSANPHVIPQLAIATMQPQPQGMTQQAKQAQIKQATAADEAASAHIELAEQQRKANAQKVYDQFSGLSEEQRAALPADQQAAYRSAQNVLYPPNRTGATKLYKLADGTTGYYHPDAIPDGAQPVLPNSMSGGGKIGSLDDAMRRYATENRIDPKDLTLDDIDYVKKRFAYDSAHNTATATTVSPGIDSTTTTSSHSVGPPPAPPRGRQGIGVQGESAAPRGGLRRPAAAAASGQPRARGGITRPPAAAASGQPSLRRAQITRQVEDKKKGMYDAAKKARDKALLTNNAKLAGDPVAKKKADDLAEQQFKEAGAAAEKWYNQQVRDIGGTPGADKKKPQGPPAGATMAYKDKNGVVQGYAVNGVYVPVGQ